MYMPVSYKFEAKDDSIWSVIKAFFASTKNEDEEIKVKIEGIEKQQDNTYINKLCKFVSAPEKGKNSSKSKTKQEINGDSSKVKSEFEVERLKTNIKKQKSEIEEIQDEIGK